MGLAAPKYRQRINDDPRNTKWSNDKNKFAYKLMQKMGWQEGRGLGMDARGQVEHVRIEQKQDTLGIGAKKDHSHAWLENNDAFNQLLESLNQEFQSDEQVSIQSTSVSTTTKSEHRLLHRKKYVNAKREAAQDSDGLNAIIGVASSSSTSTKTTTEVNTLDCTSMQISSLSTADYFKQRLEALKQSSSKTLSDSVEDVKKHDKKDKKRKRSSSSDAEDMEKPKKKKDKKEKKHKKDKKDRKEKKCKDI